MHIYSVQTLIKILELNICFCNQTKVVSVMDNFDLTLLFQQQIV